MIPLPFSVIVVVCFLVLAYCGLRDLLGDGATDLDNLYSSWSQFQAQFVSARDPPPHPAPSDEDTPFDPDFHCGPSHVTGAIWDRMGGLSPNNGPGAPDRDQVQSQTARRLGDSAATLDLQLSDGNEVTVQIPQQVCSSGRVATVTQVVSPELNAIAQDNQSQLRVDLSEQKTAVFRMDFPPTTSMPVTITDKDAARRLTSTQFIGAVAVSPQDDDDIGNDNHASVDPLPSQSDASGRISVTLPPEVFRKTPMGDYQAAVKIAVFDAATARLPCHERVEDDLHRHPCPWLDMNGKTKDEELRRIRNALIAAAFLIPELNCPLSNGTTVRTPCVETSRFNPNRNVDGSSSSHHFHKGMDISARNPRPVFLPAGGTPIGGISPQQYNREFQACLAAGYKSVAGCSYGVGGGYGIKLDMDYGDYSLTVMHLDDIDPRFLTPQGQVINAPRYNADGTMNPKALHSVRAEPVGTSGGTGAGFKNHHLHFEVYANGAGPAFCKTAGTGMTCAVLRGPVDPFPYLASRALYKPRAGAGTYVFSLSATDYEGTEVGSNVGQASENNYRPAPLDRRYDKIPYEPTRKVCVKSSSGDGITFSAPAARSVDGVNHSFCVPWGSLIVGHSTAGRATKSIEVSYSHDPSVPVSEDPQVHLTTLARTADRPVRTSSSIRLW